MLVGLGACTPRPPDLVGRASWYGRELRGEPTASGERFRPSRRTAAHRSLPFGTRLKVCAPDTGRCVRVRINDRGPFVEGRILDLSRRAATQLGIRERGVATVQVWIRRGPGRDDG